jgi:hypothetical protein
MVIVSKTANACDSQTPHYSPGSARVAQDRPPVTIEGVRCEQWASDREY